MYANIMPFGTNQCITMDNEVNAAIAMALYEAFGYSAHDEESGKLTINKKNSLWNLNIQLMEKNTK